MTNNSENAAYLKFL